MRIFKRKSKGHMLDEDNRRIAVIKTGDNSGQLVYADEIMTTY